MLTNVTAQVNTPRPRLLRTAETFPEWLPVHFLSPSQDDGQNPAVLLHTWAELRSPAPCDVALILVTWLVTMSVLYIQQNEDTEPSSELAKVVATCFPVFQAHGNVVDAC